MALFGNIAKLARLSPRQQPQRLAALSNKDGLASHAGVPSSSEQLGAPWSFSLEAACKPCMPGSRLASRAAMPR